MPKDTIRLPGKKHSMPKCFEDVLYELEALDGVERVGTGRFFGRERQKERFRVKYYNESTQTIKLTVSDNGFSQDFYLKIDSGKREYVESYIRNHP